MAVAVSPLARAQPAPPGQPPNTTTLTLSVIGEASHAPDTMIATLSAQSSAKTGAAAQAAVNAMMAKALNDANAIKGLHAVTGAYSVSQPEPKQPLWQARQELSLTFDAPPADPRAHRVLALIGNLQAEHFTLDNIGAALSKSMVRQTRNAAIADAITQLHAEAAATSSALRERVGPITHIQLNGQTPFRPMFRSMALATAPGAPPVVQSGALSEQVSLSATILLLPDH